MKVNVTKERLYSIWLNMHDRCENSKNSSYNNYGGRGIVICEDWNYYSKFCAWAWNSGYSDELSLDRIDVNGNYEPRNCRWATIKEQANNKRNNKYIECNGEWFTLAEWSTISSVSQHRISHRLSKGWKPEEAIGMVEHHRSKIINLRQRNKKWEYRFEAPKTSDGKRHHITKCGFNTKKEALEAGKRRFEELYPDEVHGGGHEVDK